MGQTKTIFVPFGELRSDERFFRNDGLTHALNVVPLYGNYISTQFWGFTGSEPSTEPYGIHAHFGGGSSWNLYLGAVTTLYEYNPSNWFSTDKTRLVGGAYGAGGAGGEAGWQSTSFGDSIIMTDYVDDPQYLASPASANFAKLALSGGANPGMDPKAKFVYAMGQNLHLANLNLAGIFDGLPAGTNPTVVCWSQSGNERQFGSFNATPELTGSDYQDLAYDLGHIAGAVGSHKFAILFLQKGIVREDGPPFTFKPIVVGASCRYPNSIVMYDQDVYFWGSAGPSVLRGGEGPVIVLGEGRVARTLIDNAVSGFSPTYSISSGIAPRHVNVGLDSVNGLVYWSFTSTSGAAASRVGDLCVIYNTRDDRFSFIDNTSVNYSPPEVDKPGIMFLSTGPDLGVNWSPGRDLVGVMRWTDDLLNIHYQIAQPDYGDVPATLPMQLTRGYQQFDEDLTTRIIRVRPILFRSNPLALTNITVQVYSKNAPLDTPISVTGSVMDSHGWIVLPESAYRDFHLIGMTIDGTALETLVELEGFEVQVLTGGRYST